MTVKTHPLDTTNAKGWHSEDIKAALRKAGTTPSALSRKHGYTAGAASMAIRGTRVSRPLRRIIARTLGVPVKELWPASKAAKATKPTEESRS